MGIELVESREHTLPRHPFKRYNLRNGIGMGKTAVRRFTDERGNEVRLTDERLRHILRRHPEMAFQMHRFAEALANPDAVRPSRSSREVQLYYRLYLDLRSRNRYICLVVKRETDYSFILTGYLARSIKGG